MADYDQKNIHFVKDRNNVFFVLDHQAMYLEIDLESLTVFQSANHWPEMFKIFNS